MPASPAPAKTGFLFSDLSLRKRIRLNVNPLKYNIVADTNVLVAAVRSRQGASYRLLELLRDRDSRCQISVSTALILEYEAVLKRETHWQGRDVAMVDKFIDDLVSVANRHFIFYRFRPWLRDADDDFILELAFSSSADYIVTYNIRNFSRSEKLGIDKITPKEFLRKIGEIS